MKIAIIQLNIIWEDKLANLEKASIFIRKAKEDGCDLIIFPEMFNSGFSMNSESISETINGETIQSLCKEASNNNINIIAGLAIKDHPLTRNVSVFISKDGIVKSEYTKNFPFSFAGENKYYKSGDDQAVFAINNFKASHFICYDLRFPELFRSVAKKVDMIFVIANWPSKRQMHWRSLLKARAIENQCFVIGVNRIGKDNDGLDYSGGSMVVDPWGEETLVGRKDQEYLVTQIDISKTKEIRTQFPFLNDMLLY